MKAQSEGIWLLMWHRTLITNLLYGTEFNHNFMLTSLICDGSVNEAIGKGLATAIFGSVLHCIQISSVAKYYYIIDFAWVSLSTIFYDL